jgi:hypothetical protein
VKTTTTTRQLWPELCYDPLVIFSITLQGMNPEENPGRIVYNHLWTHLKGNVAHVALDFNFESKNWMDSYAKRLKKVLDHLENGQLKE